MQYNWKKILTGACLSLTLLLPQAQAAEPVQSEAAANWKLIKNAMELSNQDKSYDSSVETFASIRAKDGAKISLVVNGKGDTQFSQGKSQISHNRGVYEVKVQFNDFNSTYAGDYEEYSEGKGKKFTCYTKEDNGWTKQVTELAPEFVKLVRQSAERYLNQIEKFTDVKLVGEKEGIAELTLVARPGFALPDISTLIADKEALDMWQKGRPFFVDATPDNVDTHIFIDRKTGRMVGFTASFDKWLQEELALLSTRPEVKKMPMLNGIDPENLECTLTIEAHYSPAAKDFVLTVPKEVKKAAKPAAKPEKK